MGSTIRTLWTAGMLAGAFALASPAASAQGNSQKGGMKAEKAVQKSEQKADKAVQKAERKADKTVVRTTRRASTRAAIHRRTMRTTSNRMNVLCEDGTVVRRRTDACALHGGLAARQGTFGTVYPPASARARERANANSAVVRGIPGKSGTLSTRVNDVRTNAIARCNDGMFWHSTTRTNACDGHGGVAVWY